MTAEPTPPRPFDHRAVSPAIGVVLMVAISVILSAVVGTVVLEPGRAAEDGSPRVRVSASIDGATVTLSYRSGDGLESSRTQIVIQNDTRRWVVEATATPVEMTVGTEWRVVLVAATKAGPRAGIDDAGAPWDASVPREEAGTAGRGVSVTLIDITTGRVVYEATFGT